MRHRLPLGLALVALSWGPAASATAAVRPMTGGTLRLAIGSPETAAAAPRGIASRIRASLRECTLADLLAGPPQVDPTRRHLLLRLDDALVFQNGRPILAADVVRSLGEPIKHAGNPQRFRLLILEGAATRMAGGKAKLGLRALGKRSVELTLAFPLGADALTRLSHPGLPIRGEGGTPCGPFQTRDGSSTSRRAGMLVPFERHPAGRPFFDRVQLLSEEPGRSTGNARADIRLSPAPDTPRELPLESRRLTFVQVNGADALRARIEAALDREAIVRYLVGGRARATRSIFPTVSPAPTPSPVSAQGALPAHPLTLAFDGSNAVHRRIAERIQVRLRDANLEIVLSPLPPDARGTLLTGATELALLGLPGLPTDPALGLSALTAAILGPRPAFEVLEAAALAEKEGSALDRKLEALERRLPITPLYLEDESVWESDDLQGAIPSGTLPFDPGNLWRFDPRGIESSP